MCLPSASIQAFICCGAQPACAGLYFTLRQFPLWSKETLDLIARDERSAVLCWILAGEFNCGPYFADPDLEADYKISWNRPLMDQRYLLPEWGRDHRNLGQWLIIWGISNAWIEWAIPWISFLPHAIRSYPCDNFEKRYLRDTCNYLEIRNDTWGARYVRDICNYLEMRNNTWGTYCKLS